MRYVPTYCIRENSILAKTLIGGNGEVLLKGGVQLKSVYLKKLTSLGVSGAYIEDNISADLEIGSILSDKLRVSVVRGVKNAFMEAVKQKSGKAASSDEMFALAENIVEEILASSSLLANLADIKIYDDYTFFHCVQVTILSVIMGLALGYTRPKLIRLASAALMHDVGKVFVPSEIINKKGALTPAEFEEVKKHSQIGHEYLLKHYRMEDVPARGVLDHHERFDGSGYPNGRVDKGISEFGKILAVADVYDALVSDRPYRRGMFAAEAMEFVLGGSGTLFDPEIVAIMNKKVALFPLGSCVTLSNGATALVIENYEGAGQRPKLRVFQHDSKPVEPYILDLRNDQTTYGITIVSSVAI